MKIYFNSWNAHLNQGLYCLCQYSKENNINSRFYLDKKIKKNGLLIERNEKTYFLDYSDDFSFLDQPKKYFAYFKRSLASEDFKNNVYPLNFQINLHLNPFNLLKRLPLKIFTDKNSRVELARSLDIFEMTNLSHYSQLINKSGASGRILFMTRLWNPERTNSRQEKERRILQNKFRINTCRIIKENFTNYKVGLYPDNYAIENAPDILLKKGETSRKNYLRELANSSICIADDGLKDSPGWKIGEYTFYDKAIVTTPLKSVIKDFHEGVNYVQTNDRNDFASIPRLIKDLLKDEKYLTLALNNKKWKEKYLNPENYISYILSK